MSQILRAVLLHLTVITTRCQDLPDVQLVLQRLSDGRSFNTTCVVSGNSMDSAITWNEPLPDYAYYASNYDYIPKRRSWYNCDIGDKDTSGCSYQWIGASGWSLENSLASKLGPVMDKRWEDFYIIHTDGYLNFNEFAQITNREQFKLHFSVRTQEAHMFLCDDLKPDRSNCYWIILAGWNGYGTALRKCYKGYIPSKDEIYPNEPCYTPKIRINHTLNTVLNANEWNHFTLEKNGNNILLWQIGENHLLINYTDDAVTIDTAYLLMNSRKRPGYWKLHNYFYAATTTKKNSKLGPDIEVTENNNLCISMFVAMCAKCKLNIDLVYYDGNLLTSHSIATIAVLPKKGLTWQEVKRVIQMPTAPITVSFLIDTDCNNCKNPFWAIDNFQICSENEIRVLTKTQNRDKISCQVIKYPHRQLFQTDVDTDSPDETSCPNGTFGKACVDCKNVFGDNKLHCDKSMICEFESNEGNVCRCTKGYTGTACEQKCHDGFYGFNCMEQCGHCHYTPCNYLTGKCEAAQCIYNFTGDNCKTAPLPILLYPPTVMEAKSTSFKVQIANKEHEGQGNPVFYILQYRENLEKEWNVAGQYSIANTNPVEINNLKALTAYDVRAILVDETGQTYDYEYVPKVSVTTTCTFIEENGIKRTTMNTSATLVFLDTPGKCPSDDYELLLNGRKITSDTFNFKIDHLTPFTVYTLEIKSTRTNDTMHYQFQTGEGVPSKVQGIITANNEATSIAVSWNPPTMPNGNIRYYKIQYEHTYYNSCNKRKNQDSRKTFEVHDGTSITLRNLLPYSRYRIKVAAVTILEGEYDTTYTYTKATESPEENEIPTISSTQPESSSVEIFLQQPDCTLIQGPVQYYLSLMCSEEWCPDTYLTENITNINYQEPLKVQNLLPFSNYLVTIKVGRLHGDVYSGTGMTATFATKSSVPNAIRDLVAYSRNESSVFLRWLPPYPPTGLLSDYSTSYCYTKEKGYWSSENVCNSHNFKVTECRIWKNSHCVELQHLEQNQKYTIKVYAKNLYTDFNKPSNTVVQTKQDAPEVPEQLSATWDDYYNFSLTWNHPSITNGPLTKFIIKIYADAGSGLCQNSEYKVTEETYNLTYTYVIPFATTCFSSKLTVYVSAFNIKEGPSTKLENLFSPPKTPTFDNLPSIQDVSNTTILIDLPLVKDAEKNSIGYILLATDGDEEEISPNSKNVEKIWERVNIPNQSSKWIAAEYDLRKDVSPKSFLVGNNTKITSQRLSADIYNKPLQACTNYIVTILLINEFEGKKRYSVYKLVRSTGGIKAEDSQSSHFALFALLLLLVIPIALWLLIRHYKKTKVTIPWRNMLGIANNTARHNSNPDVIPLTANAAAGKKPVVPSKPFQVKPKQNMPQDNPATIPSTSSVSEKLSKPVKITEFEKYIKESIESGELQRQHELFPRGQTKPWDYGSLPQNKSKNRYNNLIAYDHTRVRLTRINNDKFSDYINANYVQGYNTSNAYIATQGPKVSTVNDFWRMIWEENVHYIVMLANVFEGGKKKCEQYWPNVHEIVEFGNIKVEYVSSQVFADYEYRTFLVSCENNKRKIEQLHFTSWPDHGVPLYSQSLVPFLRKLLTISQGTSPIVVHCSAGVGRTGTIILCDLCLRMAAREGAVDVLKHQYNLREQRANLVDNVEQYKLAHLVLLECLIAPQTSITCDENMEKTALHLLGSGKLKEQMKYLSDTAWQDDVMRPAVEVTSHPEWAPKNRFPDISPCGYGRIYLSRYPVTEEHSDYINAVEVDGFRSPKRFIATQQPMPHTISDFWRMIDEKEVTTIVSLNKIDKEDKTCCIFWPTEKVSEIQPVPYIILKFHDKVRNEYFSIITVHLHNKKDRGTKRTVHLLILKGWPAKTLLPATHASLLKAWEETEKMSRGENPITITCYDGASACGLFIALSFIVEKMKLEQQCDVCLAVRAIRPNRKQFVTKEEQFSFLYRSALSYLSSFELYSNFSAPMGRK